MSSGVRMVRSGAAHGDRGPEPFMQLVHAPGYSESWVEGMTGFHNPRALIPLPPDMIPGASHQFLEPNGSLVSLIPEFHPLFSQTKIWVGPREWFVSYVPMFQFRGGRLLASS